MAKKDASHLIKSLYEVEVLIQEDVLSFHYQGKHAKTGERLTIIQYRESLLSPQVIRVLIQKAELLSRFKHDHLVPLADYHYDGRVFSLIYRVPDSWQYFSTVLKRKTRVDASTLWQWGMQLLSLQLGLAKQGLLAGITPRHLLLNQRNDLVVLAPTFHLEVLRRNLGELSALEDCQMYPPEFLQQQRFSVQSDIYMFGVFMQLLFGRQWPYPPTIKLAEARKQFLNPIRPFNSVISSAPRQLAQIISICLQTDPEKRFQGFFELIKTYNGEQTASAILARHKQAEPKVVQEIKQEMKRATTKRVLKTIQWSLVAVLILVVTVGAQRFYTEYMTEIPDVRIPDLAGQELSEAQQTMAAKRLRLVMAGERFHAEIPKGQIIETKPPGGRLVKRNRPVRAFVSKGPVQLLIPNLVGRTVVQSQALIQKYAERIEVVEEQFAVGFEPGLILAQSPTPNTFLAASQNIEVTISKGFPVSMRVEDTKGFFFRKRDNYRRVLLTFELLPEWDPLEITVMAMMDGRIETLHRRFYDSGTQKTLSFELELGSQVEVLVNDDVVMIEKVVDNE